MLTLILAHVYIFYFTKKYKRFEILRDSQKNPGNPSGRVLLGKINTKVYNHF